jgi:hypothetical protein
MASSRGCGTPSPCVCDSHSLSAVMGRQPYPQKGEVVSEIRPHRQRPGLERRARLTFGKRWLDDGKGAGDGEVNCCTGDARLFRGGALSAHDPIVGRIELVRRARPRHRDLLPPSDSPTETSPCSRTKGSRDSRAPSSARSCAPVFAARSRRAIWRACAPSPGGPGPRGAARRAPAGSR